MDMPNNNAIFAIAESIVSACKEILSKAKYDVTFQSVVIAEPDNTGYYGIMYKGNEVHIPNYSGKELSINAPVFVTIPSNEYSKMYIAIVLDQS